METESVAKFDLDFGEGDMLGCENDFEEILCRLNLKKDVKFIHVHTRVLDLEWLDDLTELNSWPEDVCIRMPNQPETPGFMIPCDINLPPKAIAGLPCKALTILQYSIIDKKKSPRFLFVAQFPGCSHFERIGFGSILRRGDYYSMFFEDEISGWNMEKIVLG